MKAGTGIFFDGLVSVRRDVTVELKSDGVVIRDPVERDQLARWPYDQLEQIAAPEGVFRVGRAGSKILARLEVRDADLAHAIDEASIPVDRSGTTERRSRRKIVAWSFAAVASILIAAFFGVPAFANWIAPMIPLRFEHVLGDAVDTQIRAMLDTNKVGAAFECGGREGEAAGRAALNKLVGRLETAATLPIPVAAAALRSDQVNAIALPGGRVYVFQGLIDKAESADELAGVIAHELGHVAHRDGTRSILQSAGLSFLFGMLLGDFIGGGAVVVGAQEMLRLSYSRDVESAADRFGLDLMAKIGGDQRAFGAILKRIGSSHPGKRLLLDHPDTEPRVAAINALATATPASAKPLLESAEWAALKRICAGR